MIRTKKQILDVLEKAYEHSKYVIFGEQCATKQKPNDLIANYAEKSGGHKPAILGIDLGCYGFRLTTIGEGSPEWKEYLDQVVEFAEQGGIVTASAHLTNPHLVDVVCDKCRGKFGGSEEWEAMLTEGTELNKIVKAELIIIGKFLKELGDRGVTVLWRPLHEANGGWFWFCARSHKEMPWIDPEYLRRFWRYIYNLYETEMGLKNLIWVYSPNVSQNDENSRTVREVMFYYPGDEYVDMVGLDWYTAGNFEINSPGHAYDRIMAKRKIAAITEFGPRGDLRLPREATDEQQAAVYNSVDAVNIIKTCVEKGLKISYVLTWHTIFGAFSRLGKAKEALDDPFCVDLERLNNLFE